MYVVAGVSGHTGKVVAETLLAKRAPVRAVVRSAAKGEEWKRRGAEVAVADLDDEGALTTALRGAKGAYLLLPPRMESTDSRADNARRADVLVRAIEASGVEHVVFLSSVGAHLPSGTGPILSVHDAEAKLRGVNADVTFVRAAYFMENLGASLYALGDGAFPTFLRAGRPLAMIATRDIGVAAAEALLAGGTGKAAIELAGPRDYTPEDVAGALSQIVGKEVKAAVGPIDAMPAALAGAGVNAHWAGLYREMTEGMNEGTIGWEHGASGLRRGTTDVEAVLRSLIAS